MVAAHRMIARQRTCAASTMPSGEQKAVARWIVDTCVRHTPTCTTPVIGIHDRHP